MLSCLVTLPSGANFDRLYKEILVNIVRSAGLNPIRVPDLHRPHALDEILGCFDDAAVCIADLTAQNPGVFYVLGVAQGLGTPVVILVQNAGELPFDLKLARYLIVYRPDGPRWQDMLSLQLQAALRRIAP